MSGSSGATSANFSQLPVIFFTLFKCFLLFCVQFLHDFGLFLHTLCVLIFQTRSCASFFCNEEKFRCNDTVRKAIQDVRDLDCPRIPLPGQLVKGAGVELGNKRLKAHTIWYTVPQTRTETLRPHKLVNKVNTFSEVDFIRENNSYPGCETLKNCLTPKHSF